MNKPADLDLHHDHFRLMAESLPQKLFTATETGKIDYCNPIWTTYLGISRSRLLATGWKGSVHPDDVAENMRRWQYSLESGEPFEYEHRLKRHDGVYRWHLMRANPMRDDVGLITKWVGSDIDIDDYKHRQELEIANASLKKQRTTLLAINRAKDEFISLASHQLRTPATGVKQYLGMVLDGFAGELTPDQRLMLVQAYDSNDRQIHIVNDLLQVATVDAGKVELQLGPVELGLLTAQVIDEQTDAYQNRQQKIVFKQPNRSCYVTADHDKLRQVLENIIDNASKYTPEGKSVTIGIRQTDDMAFVTIKDQGVGIPEGQAARVFDKFTRLENPLSATVGGTGLGLYWALKIMQLHGGEITVTSRPDKGSTFTVCLPRQTA